MKLLLFDIDGTLLTADGMGRGAFEAALGDLVGQPISTRNVSFSGKTDPQILREILHLNGCPAAFLDGRFHEALARFESTATASFDPKRVRLHDGVEALLSTLEARNDVQLGLLTGNLKRTAYLKLRAVQLDTRFPFGAFGSDHEDRTALPAVAVERARDHTGHTFAGKDVVIIGDTEHDITCGRSLGVFSVAVATGRYDRDALAAHDPDLLLDDLTDIRGFVEKVVGGNALWA